jgi:hypothetical protein
VTVLSIQNSLSVSHEHEPSMRERFELALMKRRFPALDGAIALSDGVAMELRRLVPALASPRMGGPQCGYAASAQVKSALAVERPSSNTTCRILACGRLVHQKDYPTLLQAFALLEGDLDLRLDILGEGSCGPIFSLWQRSSRSLSVFGFSVSRTIPICTCVVLISSCCPRGGKGLVTCSSKPWAMGAPVVSTDCPHGPAEIIENGRTGFLVPPREPASLAQALQTLVDDPSLRRAFGEAGRVQAQRFSTEVVGAAYARHFRSFAGNAASALSSE